MIKYYDRAAHAHYTEISPVKTSQPEQTTTKKKKKKETFKTTPSFSHRFILTEH